MVLKRVWTVDQKTDYVSLPPLQERTYKMIINRPGHYHFVCGLPDDLRTGSKKITKLRHKIGKATAEKSKSSVKVKFKVFNKYQVLVKEKQVITLKGKLKDGEIHYHFDVKSSILTQPLHMRVKMTSYSYFKRMKVSALLYRDLSTKENEKEVMRSFMKYIFEPKESNEEESKEEDESLELNHSAVTSHLLSKDELGTILLQVLFSESSSSPATSTKEKDSLKKDKDFINVIETKPYKTHLKTRSPSQIRQTIVNNLKQKYSKVEINLVENPHKQDTPECEQESTFLTNFQIQMLNYDLLPSDLQNSVWKQKYNSKIFGHNLNEIIRLCSQTSEPQIIIIQDDEDYIFGGFLRHGLYLKNTYSDGLPTVFKQNFSLNNYDFPQSYSEFLDESDSLVFSFYKSSSVVTVFENKHKNRMFRFINKKGFGMGGEGGGFAFYVDHTVQHGSSNTCHTYENEVLASGTTFNIRNLEIWTLEPKF